MLSWKVGEGVKKPRRKRSVEILGQKVKIKYTSKVLFDDGDELHGCFDSNTMTIHISKDSEQHATLCHEIFHSILHISGVGQRLSMKDEEAICVAFEHALKDFLVF